MNYYFYRFISFIKQGAIPFTKLILVLSGLNFILNLLLNTGNILTLVPANLPGFFWTFLTYPLINPKFDFLTLVFSGLWLWFVGGSLERTWGTRMYGFFFILVTLVTGGVMSLVAIMTGIASYPIFGLWLPLVGITWAWATVYPEREILIWGIIPVKATWLAWIEAGMTFFNYWQVNRNLLFGLASISGIVLVYLFGDTGKLGRGLRYRSWRRDECYPKRRRSRLKIIK